MSGVNVPKATVPILFKYETKHGEHKTDKGGKGVLWSEAGKLFLLTTRFVALYEELKEGEKVNAVCLPQKKKGRTGTWELNYANLLKDTPLPSWIPYSYVAPSSGDTNESSGSNEEHIYNTKGFALDLKKHDTIYYLDVTECAWANCMEYSPLTTRAAPKFGDLVRFASQRVVGTGFLAEKPQWRRNEEVSKIDKKNVYPGAEKCGFSVQSVNEAAPFKLTNCSDAKTSYMFPEAVDNTYPPMFLINVNVQDSSRGWPVLSNNGKDLVGLISTAVENDEGKCYPGTWCIALPCNFHLVSEEEKQRQQEEAEELERQQQLKRERRKQNKKKKKGKKKK